MCNCNTQDTIENYGPVHLHPNEYPIPQDERGLHKCHTGMYPCDQFPEGYHMPMTSECPPNGPVVMRHSSDPAVRYGFPGDAASNNEVGTGCMNLNCMCPNCHGDCKCGNCGKEEFVGYVGLEMNMTNIIVLAILGYVAWRLYNGKKLF